MAGLYGTLWYQGGRVTGVTLQPDRSVCVHVLNLCRNWVRELATLAM
jgi:hypothetical protein